MNVGCESNNGFVNSMFPPAPGEVAREAFNVYDPDRRRRAVNTLASAPWGGEATYLRTYRLLVDDPDPTVRAACLRALARHGYPSDVSAITPYLRDRTSFVRWEAAMALERLHHPDAVDPLVATLREDEDADVRLAAARALGQYPQDRVFETLVGALNDRQYSVVRQAARSLRLLTGADIGDSNSAWLAWADEQGGNLFAKQEPFHYQEFIRPPGVLDHMQFWREYPVAEPRQPSGLEGTQRVEVAERAADPPADETTEEIEAALPPATEPEASEEAAPPPPRDPEPVDAAAAEDDEEEAARDERRGPDHPLGATDSE
ncbi:MAG: HEAT repeat domain-containing protein [Phycisphaeraceae bacterium]